MKRGVGGQPHKTPRFNSRHQYTHTPEWLSQEEPGSGLTASAPVSDVFAPACTNGAWPPLRPVRVAQKNKPSAMLSSNVQSIDLPMDCTTWRFWTMRQPNGCSTPAPKSGAVKQWIKEELAQTKEAPDLEDSKWVCCENWKLTLNSNNCQISGELFKLELRN